MAEEQSVALKSVCTFNVHKVFQQKGAGKPSTVNKNQYT